MFLRRLHVFELVDSFLLHEFVVTLNSLELILRMTIDRGVTSPSNTGESLILPLLMFSQLIERICEVLRNLSFMVKSYRFIVYKEGAGGFKGVATS